MRRLEGFALIVLVLMTAPLRAAVPISPELQTASEAERYRQIQMQAELSLHEKIQVGKERYQERQAFRQALVESMKAEAVERRAEITGTAPVVTAPRQSFDPADLMLGALIVFAVYQVFRYFQSQEFGSRTMKPPLTAEAMLAEAALSQGAILDYDWKQIVATAHLASEAQAKTGAKEQEELRQKLAGITSVKLCLDISRTLILTVTEARIREHLQSLLTPHGITTDDKSEIMLALVVQGDFNSRNQTFTHKEKFVLLQSGGKKGLLGPSKPQVLWGAEYTGFATDLEVENDVVTVVEVLADMFITERARVPVPVVEEASAATSPPAEAPRPEAELNLLAVPHLSADNAAAKA